MAPRSRRRTGEGFSLVELQPVLTKCTSDIADELSSQGVDIDTNSLLMGIQQIVNSLVMNNPGALMASDDNNKPPYNLAADLLAMGYHHFHSGNKKEAVKSFLTACEFEDAATLNEALLMMNNSADVNKRLTAAEADTDEDETTDDSADDSDDDGEMTDEEIDDLINENDDENSEDDDTDEEEDDSTAPMGGASSAKSVTASITPESRARRVLAIKMSSAGDEKARRQAQRLLG